MPQLDRIIIFPQIFWLVLTFVVTYTLLLHYFLPKFLKSLKSRKEIVNFNTQKFIQMQHKYDKKILFLNRSLNKNLSLVKDFLIKDYLSVSLHKFDVKLDNVDTKLSFVFRNLILYYNIYLVNNIRLQPKSLSFKDNQKY